MEVGARARERDVLRSEGKAKLSKHWFVIPYANKENGKLHYTTKDGIKQKDERGQYGFVRCKHFIQSRINIHQHLFC